MKRIKLSGAAFKKRRVIRETEKKRNEGALLKYFNNGSLERPHDQASVLKLAEAGRSSEAAESSNASSRRPKIDGDGESNINKMTELDALISEDCNFLQPVVEDHAHSGGDEESLVLPEGERSTTDERMLTSRAREPFHMKMMSLSPVCGAETPSMKEIILTSRWKAPTLSIPRILPVMIEVLRN